MSLYAVLDNIELEIITWLDGLDMRFAAEYAEHGLIGRKSMIQHTGWRPDEVSIRAALHASWCDPAAEVARLKEAMDAARPLAFVLGTGEYRGVFVIESLDVTTRHTDGVGTVIAFEVEIGLKEYIGDPAEPTPPGVIRDGYRIPMASEMDVPAVPGAYGGPIDRAGAAAAGAISAIGAVAEAVTGVETLARVASFDPAAAALMLPRTVEALDGASAALASGAMAGLESIIAVAADAAAVATSMTTARRLVDTASGVLSGVTGALAALRHVRAAADAMEDARASLARIGRSAALREDALWLT